jgi:hypothetical protein
MFDGVDPRNAPATSPDNVKVAALIVGGMLAVASAATVGLAIAAAHAPDAHPLEAGLAAWCIAGAIILAFAGVVLVLFGAMKGDDRPESIPSGPYPVTFEARLDEPLSRWTWLVKWILLVPHAVVLPFLWAAFGMLTVVAFFSIAACGRYPAALFATNVGILRWSWRVAFYGYGALGTDRYPPFTLRDVDYPIRLHVAYPQRLSRRLVWVKSWLLALPHYALIAVFSGSTPGHGGGTADGPRTTGGLVPLLVLFAAIAMLFTGRYPRGIFDLLMGLHRWILRVVTYVALMHDVYPPFRVDLGGTEFSTAASSPVSPPSAVG